MEREDPLVHLLRDLVALDTTNPPGREDRACDALSSRLLASGVQAEILRFAPGRGTLHARLPGRTPGPVVLCGHLDTVPVGEGWHGTPFHLSVQPSADGERLVGLGACDMKGGVAALVRAFEQVAADRASNGARDPAHPLVLLLTADEEDAYRGAALAHARGLVEDAAFVVVAEPTDGRIGIGERGAFWVRVTFRGREAHGSTPGEGVNAAAACVRFLASLEARLQALPGTTPAGPPTWNLGRIAGGRQANIVPDACVADLDFRIAATAERFSIERLLDEEGTRATPPGGAFTWETLSWMPPCATDPDHPLVRTLATTFHEVTGRPPILETVPFCTDLPSLFPDRCPPFVVFGPGNIRQAHQPDEWVSRRSLDEVTGVITSFVSRICGG